MRIRIEFEEVLKRRVHVNCTDLHVARELWENNERIRNDWVEESDEYDSFVDPDASFYPEEK